MRGDAEEGHTPKTDRRRDRDREEHREVVEALHSSRYDSAVMGRNYSPAIIHAQDTLRLVVAIIAITVCSLVTLRTTLLGDVIVLQHSTSLLHELAHGGILLLAVVIIVVVVAAVGGTVRVVARRAVSTAGGARRTV